VVGNGWEPDHGWRVYPAEQSGANMPSTAIRNTQYDPATRTLSVWFVPSGNRYDYADVAPATYAAFMKASSKGRFFNEFIRDRYSYRRVA
jgi:hypothetical protein